MTISLQFIIILTYFVILLIVGLLTQKLAKSEADFLIAGRNLGLVLCSVVVVGEWLGGMSTIGVSERAYASGFSPAWYNISTALGMLIFGLTLAVVYRKHHVYTVAEMIEKLYSRNTRVVAAVAFLIAYIILAYVQVQTVGSVMASTLHIPLNAGIIVGGLLVTIYITAGGFWSITFTNLIHVTLLYTSLITVFIIALIKIGGYGGLFRALEEAGRNIQVYQSPFGIGVSRVFAWIIGGIFGAFAAQASIQPVFAAKDLKTARNASLLSALFIAPVGIMTATLGMVAATGKFANVPNPKQALPSLLMSSNFIPPWLGGIALAGILAAILSTIAPVMFAVSTILTKDIYHLLLHKEATDSQLLKKSRIFTLVVGLVSIPLAIYLRGFILDTAYISYAIRTAAAVIVVGGVYWIVRGKRIPTPKAASWALLGGTFFSLLFVILKYAVGFKVDKVYGALFSSLVLLIIISLIDRRKS